MADYKGIETGSQRIRAHTVHIDSRELMSITGVKDVMSFNEQEVTLYTEGGELHIDGTGLHITKLNLDDGHVVLEGELSAMFYEEPRQERGSLFSRMFR